MNAHSGEEEAARVWVTQHSPIISLGPWDYHDEPEADAGLWAPWSPYVRRFWVPILGPTPYLALLAVNDVLSDGGHESIDLGRLAEMLGVGGSQLRPDSRHEAQRPGKSSVTVRSLARLIRFSLARPEGERLFVATAVPQIPEGLRRKLPEFMRAEHARLLLQFATDAASVTS